MWAAPLGQRALTLTPDGGLGPPALQRESVLSAVALAHCPTRKPGSGGMRARPRVGAEVEWAPLASPAPQARPVTALPSGFTETRGWLCPPSHVEPRPWAPGWRMESGPGVAHGRSSDRSPGLGSGGFSLPQGPSCDPWCEAHRAPPEDGQRPPSRVTVGLSLGNAPPSCGPGGAPREEGGDQVRLVTHL